MTANANLIIQHSIQTKTIMKHANKSVKIIVHAIIVGILAMLLWQ